MKKKDYQKPTMQVVGLQHTTALLQASFEATRNTYGQEQEQETWEEQD